MGATLPAIFFAAGTLYRVSFTDAAANTVPAINAAGDGWEMRSVYSIAQTDTLLGQRLLSSSNLSDLGNSATARTNLGLGSAATRTAGAAAGNVPILDGSGLLPTSLLPAIAFGERFSAASQVAMLALNAEIGDVCKRTDQLNRLYMLTDTDATQLSNWATIGTSGTITSVNGQAGPVVNLTTSDISEGSNLYYTTVRVNADAPNVTLGASALGISLVGQVLSTNATIAATGSTLVYRTVAGNIAGVGFLGTTLALASGSNGSASKVITVADGDPVYYFYVTAGGTCAATLFSGSGASLTNIPAGQLTGTLPNGVFPATIPTGIAAGAVLISNGSGITSDASVFFYDATNHKLVVGTNSASSSAQTLQIRSNASNGLLCEVYNASSGTAPNFIFRRGRGTIASPAAATSGDRAFTLSAQALDTGLANRVAATMTVNIDGTVTGTGVPGAWFFNTAPNGTAKARLSLSSNGQAWIAAPNLTPPSDPSIAPLLQNGNENGGITFNVDESTGKLTITYFHSDSSTVWTYQLSHL